MPVVAARRLPAVFALLAAVVLAGAPAGAQEKKISLIFTAELVSQIATDNLGEQSSEIIDRIIGLSPSVLNVRIERSGGRVSLIPTVSGADELPVTFQFTLDKMVYYRMRTARGDITGMTGSLQEAKDAEPLLREVGYRFDGRYSIIDLTLDLRPAAKAAREMQDRRAAESARAAEEARAADEAKRAEEALAAETAAAARKAQEVRAAEAARKAEAARAAEARAAEERAAAEAARARPAPAPPEERPRPAPRESDAPEKEATYLAAAAIGRERTPTVDGLSLDPAWQAAVPFSVDVQGPSGRLSVLASAVWSPDRIWVLLRWPDKSRDDVHRPWVWSKDEKAYVAGREVEDALSLTFAREGRMGECMLAGVEASTDLWTWRAGRTDASGHAEDATMTMSFKRLPRVNSYQTRNGRTVWIKEEPDGGSPPFQAQIVGAYAGERIPRYIPRTPSGSMADVAAKGSWKDGYWTVEFSRRLSTGDPVDAVLAPGRDIFFSVAVFNSREGIDHSTSKELTLRLE